MANRQTNRQEVDAILGTGRRTFNERLANGASGHTRNIQRLAEVEPHFAIFAKLSQALRSVREA